MHLHSYFPQFDLEITPSPVKELLERRAAQKRQEAEEARAKAGCQCLRENTGKNICP